MKKIKLFLACSNELKHEREQFEIKIYRKCKTWFDKGIFLQLDIWEDMSARMSKTGSQSEYNKYVKDADLFIFLAFSKVGMYTEEEFEQAFGAFQSKTKPFIFTYFKTAPVNSEDSLIDFKKKLHELNHFYSNFESFDALWNQFNGELDRLELDGFSENKKSSDAKIINQQADKIYNIDNLDNANFS